MDIFSTFVIIICLICVLIAFKLWAKYGKDKQAIETVELYPPEGYNSAEIGFLYEGNASNQSIISLLIYLANKGYLQIEETEEKKLFSKSKGFKITKLKEYDGNNNCEKIFFNGLFKGGATGTLKSVTETDLNNKFYIILNEIKSNLNSKKSKYKILDATANKKSKWLILMIIVIFILITIKPMLEYFESEFLGQLFILILIGYLFSLLFTIVLKKTQLIEKIFNLVFIGIIGVIPCAIIFIPCLLQNIFYLVTYFIGIVCIVAISVCYKKLTSKRTAYGNKILGKLKGFKRFLETSEKSQLEHLIMQNPGYFYDILPYTYALGVSDIWLNKFDSIEVPHWYIPHNNFNIYTFRTLMNSILKVMSSEPSFGAID